MTKHISVADERILCDLKLILNGAFSPLPGFMGKDDYDSVINSMKMSSGTIFPLPVVFPIRSSDCNKINCGNIVMITDNAGTPIARMTVEEIYAPDFDREREMYGDKNHPYVSSVIDERIRRGYTLYMSGPVSSKNLPRVVTLADSNEFHNMNPAEMREHITAMGYDAVIGFQTRNPMHKSHFHLTKYAVAEAERSGCKKPLLLIQPVVGITQVNDVPPYVRMKCYDAIVRYYSNEDFDVLINYLPLSMRMAGPREALLHALIRKNYGCTHFIVGRDHAGPSCKNLEGKPFYDPYGAHELLDSINIGINVIKSKMIVYEPTSQQYLPLDKLGSASASVSGTGAGAGIGSFQLMPYLTLSGTEFRRMLSADEHIPEWFSFPEVTSLLRRYYKIHNRRGICIYIIGLPCSGKTTLANALGRRIEEETFRKVTILDGDVVRKNLSKGLTFSKEDRSTNVRRIGYVASEIVRHRGIAICANIAPYEDDRAANRKLIEQFGTYVEVFMNTTLAECEQRDVKGLYRLARTGVIDKFTGISDPFHQPMNATIEFSENDSLDYCVDTIYNAYFNRIE